MRKHKLETPLIYVSLLCAMHQKGNQQEQHIPLVNRSRLMRTIGSVFATKMTIHAGSCLVGEVVKTDKRKFFSGIAFLSITVMLNLCVKLEAYFQHKTELCLFHQQKL